MCVVAFSPLWWEVGVLAVFNAAYEYREQCIYDICVYI